MAALVTLFLVGVVLRPQIVGIGPLLPRIESSLGISHTVAGLLSTIPVLCMGVFAPLAPSLLSRFGSRSAIGFSLGAVGVVGVARALTPGAAPVLALTVPIGIGIAVAGTLLPVVVKDEHAERVAIGTGAYTAGINVGATVASVVAVPLALLWSWRLALLVFSAAAFVVALGWLGRSHRTPRFVRAPLPLRAGVAWKLAGVFALQSSIFYGLNAWLPETYVDRGWSQSAAGALIALLNGVALVVGLLTALANQRGASRRAYICAAAAASTAGTALIATNTPSAWAWAGLLGVTTGILFTTVMTLPLDVASAPAEIAAMTALMLGVGYTSSALAPTVLGALRDATGSFVAPFAVLAAIAALMLGLGTRLQTFPTRT